MNILIFGDSITYGAWDEEGGWAQRLRIFLDGKTLFNPSRYLLVYNLGISGDDSNDLLERLEFESKMRAKEDEELVYIFAIGENDAQFINSKNDLRVSKEKFKENIKKIIDIARKLSQKIIFIGLTPADERKTMPIEWNKDIFYKNENIEEYDAIAKLICKEEEVLFVDILDQLEKLDYLNLLEDGVHPNSEGHRIMFEIIKKFLVENKII